MTYTVERFGTACRDLLKAEPGAAGREKVVALLREVLKDQDFVSSAITDNTPERQILYEDPELGFCVLAHRYEGPKNSQPHDHGPSWAIYGQAGGETEMTDWKLLEPASETAPGKVKQAKVYKLTPGMACLYNEGDLHSPRREGPVQLLRVEGQNMDNVKRLSYRAV